MMIVAKTEMDKIPDRCSECDFYFYDNDWSKTYCMAQRSNYLIKDENLRLPTCPLECLNQN